MRVLVALKLTSDSLMVSEAIVLKNTKGISKLFLITDRRYETEIDGVNYYYINSFIARIPVVRVFARIPYMISLCLKEKIDLLVCYHLTSYGLAGFIVSLLLKKPLSVHFLGNDIDVLCKKPFLGKLLLKVARLIDILTVQGSKSKRFLNNNGVTNIHIIPTACDVYKFTPKPTKKTYHVIFLGRLSEEKRIDRFLEIILLIIKRGFPVKAVIVGTGPEEYNMLRQIDRLNLHQFIDYIGWTNDVNIYLAQSQVFVLTSDNDQLPSSLIEAMAAGLVPVVSNVGNVSDIVDESNGYVFDKEDTESFASAIIHLLKERSIYLRKSQAAQKRSKQFSLEANSRRWETVIHELGMCNEK